MIRRPPEAGGAFVGDERCRARQRRLQEVTGADMVFSVTVNDATPPNTVIVAKNIKGRRAKFRFTSSEPGSSFKCKLDKRPFRPCGTPRTYKKLKPGKHTFKVRATDAVGNTDLTPARRKFKI